MPITPPRNIARATCGIPQVPLVTPKTLMPEFRQVVTTVLRVALDFLEIDGDLRSGHGIYPPMNVDPSKPQAS
jgi:hypothetical protein